MSSFQTQIASIMEILVNAALAEMRKIVNEGFGVLHLERCQHHNENKTQKGELPLMENEVRDSLETVCELRMTQLATILGILAQEAVNKICSLFSKESAMVLFEVTETQNENETAKAEVQTMDRGLRIVHGSAEEVEKCVDSLSVGIQVGNELRPAVTEREGSPIIRGNKDTESLQVEEEHSAFQTVVLMDEGLLNFVLRRDIRSINKRARRSPVLARV
ncbi:uncharacterized protein LOC125712067 isoform X3 [Brienomyrus brachyistius]|uniref:uncharacterized protein LOC125712067 isoform X3 n=1 Tax=Brienomyrus brachyistius TaxID=42636 RepID=UPI0020B24FD4|nr:uncharacterized protein LOC125712067 isoform X3 [Brienomyrus brachyistius]